MFIDKGWTALLPPGAEAIIIQTPGQQGMILATADRADRARVKATLSTSIPVDAGVVLKPRGAVKAQGDRLSARYSAQTTAGTFEGYAVARLSKDGRAVAFIGLAPPPDIDRIHKAVDALAKSTRFFAIPPAATQATPASDSGAPALAGLKLHRFFGDSSYREHQIMVLCKNGRFFWNMESGGFTPGVASGAFESQGHGRWSLQGSQLQLFWDNGSQRVYRVEMREGSLYLDGNKWLREAGGC